MACEKYNLIQDIIAFSKSAANLYDKLAEIEYNGQVGSKEYFECIDFLRQIKEYENKKWDQLKLNTEFFQNYMEYICRYHNLMLQDMLFALNVLNDDEVEYKRFVAHGQHIAAKRNETIYADVLSEEDIEQYKKELEEQYGCEVEIVSPYEAGVPEEDIDQYMDKQILAEEEIRNEIELLRNEALSHTYIMYLDDYIKKTKSKRIKKQLLKAKYRTICINDSLEDYFLDRAPQYLMPKLFQRCVETDIKGKEQYYKEVYIDFLQAEIEEAIRELDTIECDELPLNEGGLYALIETIYTRACNSVNPSYDLDSSLQIIKQNALKYSKSDLAKEKIIDSFKLDKKLTMSKNVDL